MSQQLSLSARPKSFDELVGQEKMVAQIRGHMREGRTISGWMFTGPTGCGKTTLARIMAISLQCEHQKKFGKPCLECRRNRTSFDIHEINAAKVTGKADLEALLEGADYAPRVGKYRIYVIDEIHRASGNAQDMMLKYVEDASPSTVYILCSANPQRIDQMLQGRCLVYQLRALSIDDTTKLVETLLVRVQSKKPADRLAEALVDRGISYPRLIAHAVEKYVAGAKPEDAVEVEGSAIVDVKNVTRAIVKGEWDSVAKYLHKAQASDMRGVRLGVLAYLRGMLLNSADVEDRTGAVAKAILTITSLQNMEDIALSAGLAASLYQVTAHFARYKR